MVKSIFDLKSFIFKYLRPVKGEHRIDERADADLFKQDIRERLIAAICDGAASAPVVLAGGVATSLGSIQIAHKGKGFVVQRVEFMRQAALFRGVFLGICKAFPVAYIDESAAVLDAYLQDEPLQRLIEDTCATVVASVSPGHLEDAEACRAYLSQGFRNRLGIELEKYFEERPLLVLCVARQEGCKGPLVFNDEDGALRSILDRKNFKNPIFEDQYKNTSNVYRQ